MSNANILIVAYSEYMYNMKPKNQLTLSQAAK